MSVRITWADRVGVAAVDRQLQASLHERIVQAGHLRLERQQTFAASLASELDQGLDRRAAVDRRVLAQHRLHDRLEHPGRGRELEAGHRGAQRAAQHDEQSGDVADEEDRADVVGLSPHHDRDERDNQSNECCRHLSRARRCSLGGWTRRRARPLRWRAVATPRPRRARRS